MPKEILVYGSGVFANVVRVLVETCGHEFGGYIDDFNSGPEIVGDYEFVRSNYASSETGIVIAIGYNHFEARWDVYKKVLSDNFEVPALIHPASIVNDRQRISPATMVMAAALVDVNASVGELSVLWPGVLLNHDSSVGDNIFVSPGAIICGCCQVGSNTFVGAGAIISDHVEVPDNSFIPAGELITPASKVKSRRSK